MHVFFILVSPILNIYHTKEEKLNCLNGFRELKISVLKLRILYNKIETLIYW